MQDTDLHVAHMSGGGHGSAPRSARRDSSRFASRVAPRQKRGIQRRVKIPYTAEAKQNTHRSSTHWLYCPGSWSPLEMVVPTSHGTSDTYGHLSETQEPTLSYGLSMGYAYGVWARTALRFYTFPIYCGMELVCRLLKHSVSYMKGCCNQVVLCVAY